MVNPMLRFTGYTGLTPHATHILQGTFSNPAPHDQDLQDFLTATQHHLGIHPAKQSLSNSITAEDFRKNFATIKETKRPPHQEDITASTKPWP